MGGAVVRVPRKSKTEWIGLPESRRAVQFLTHIIHQVGLFHFQVRGAPGVGDGAEQFKVRQPAYIIKIQSISGIVRPGDVGMRPVCCDAQIENRIGVLRLDGSGQSCVANAKYSSLAPSSRSSRHSSSP